MTKDIDKFETTHFSYSDYKKKVHKGPNKYLVVFSSVFFAGVLLMLGTARVLSPNVDLGFGDEADEISQYEDERNMSSVIDERLKHIQMEDEGKFFGPSGEMFSPELDEKVVIPRHSNRYVVNEPVVKEPEIILEKPKIREAEKPIVQKKLVQKSETQEQKTVVTPVTPVEHAAPQIVNAKVVVGYYAAEKQAEVAKSILQDAGLGLNPIVKNMGGYYTLQVGSYTSRDKAQQAANNLLKSNFPARVVVE